MTIDGCTITGNTSKANGGGVWNGPGSTINMQGKNTVTDNQSNGNMNNVYLRDGVVITVTGALTDSKIGIRMEKPDVFTSGYSTNNKDVSPVTIFVSDDSDYKVVASDNEAKLVKNFETAVNGIEDAQGKVEGIWYDLNGRKIANGQKPIAKGIYMNNGRKVVVK